MSEPRWLLLIHRIPSSPNYLRLQIARKLAALGAAAIKQSVYALPRTASGRDSLTLVAKEVRAGGGEASICEASFVEGLSNEDVESLFRTARELDYASLIPVATALWSSANQADSKQLDSSLRMLRRRLAKVAAVDFFEASGKREAEELIVSLEAARLTPPSGQAAAAGPITPSRVHGAIWVTRTGVLADRIASAWLIRRFIDPRARFRFVSGKDATMGTGEHGFDMPGGEFTHEEDRCTFETLVRRFGLSDPALSEIAEIVHDMDLKDGKFGRVEAAGIQQMILGLAQNVTDDRARIARGSPIFDSLYTSFCARLDRHK